MPDPQETLTSKDLPERVWIGAGARDGERLPTLRAALRLLAERGAPAARVSSLYETEPVELAGDRTLLNGAIEVPPTLCPRDLMAACLAVERALGRQRGAGDRRDAARPIDLDILLYGSRVLGEAGLTIPHPRMHLRRFVLEPLAEIAPEARHPGLGRSVAELMAACPDRSWVKPFARPEEWLVEVMPRFR